MSDLCLCNLHFLEAGFRQWSSSFLFDFFRGRYHRIPLHERVRWVWRSIRWGPIPILPCGLLLGNLVNHHDIITITSRRAIVPASRKLHFRSCWRRWRYFGGILIVFTNEDHRKLPGCHVKISWKAPLLLARHSSHSTRAAQKAAYPPLASNIWANDPRCTVNQPLAQTDAYSTPAAAAMVATSTSAIRRSGFIP
jgi:hypothetical protein